MRGLYADENGPRSAANTPGFTQTYTDVNGNAVTVQPFLIGPAQNSSAVDSVDHRTPASPPRSTWSTASPRWTSSPRRIYAVRRQPRRPPPRATQFARLVMAHVDCDTIPFLWNFASRFTIFDRIFATEDTPSTPNAIAMIAGQAGETQWVKHGGEPRGAAMTASSTADLHRDRVAAERPARQRSQPVLGLAISTRRRASEQPTVAQERESTATGNIAENLTFASLPLTFQGRNITSLTAQTIIRRRISPTSAGHPLHPGAETPLRSIGAGTRRATTSNRPTPTAIASHYGYVSHHNGAQYFGYISDTPAVAANLQGEADFFADIASNALPERRRLLHPRRL